MVPNWVLASWSLFVSIQLGATPPMLIGYRVLELNPMGFRSQGIYSSHLAIHRILVKSGTLHSIVTTFLLGYRRRVQGLSLLRRLATSTCVLRLLSTLPGCDLLNYSGTVPNTGHRAG